MEYILIKKSNFQEFKLEIKNNTENGWELHGDEFSFNVLNTTIYTQAMIKKGIESNIDSIQQTVASWNVG